VKPVFVLSQFGDVIRQEQAVGGVVQESGDFGRGRTLTQFLAKPVPSTLTEQGAGCGKYVCPVFLFSHPFKYTGIVWEIYKGGRLQIATPPPPSVGIAAQGKDATKKPHEARDTLRVD
jgi:hypothetical protein